MEGGKGQDMWWDKVFETVLTQPGPFAALFIGACLVIGYLFRELRKGEKEHQVEIKELLDKRDQMFEARLNDSKTIVLALEQNSRANVALELSVKERSAAVQDLTTAFAGLVSKLDIRDERWLDYCRAIDRRIEDLARNVR